MTSASNPAQRRAQELRRLALAAAKANYKHDQAAAGRAAMVRYMGYQGVSEREAERLLALADQVVARRAA